MTCFLAERGFVITGIDVSVAAITAARFDAEKRGLTDARFVVGDVLQEPNQCTMFEFIGRRAES